MARHLHILALCLVGALAGGCIHLEQRVRINANGSGVVEYEYSVAEETFATVVAGRLAIAEWQGAAPEGLDWFTSEAAVKRFFAGDQFEVQYYRTFRKGGRRHVRVVLLLPDLQAAFATGRLGDFRLDRTDAGNGRFRRLPPAKPEPEAPLGDEDTERLRALCDDLWLRLVVHTPGDIVSTTATERKDRLATWTFDPGQDDGFLRRRPEIEVVFTRRD